MGGGGGGSRVVSRTNLRYLWNDVAGLFTVGWGSNFLGRSEILCHMLPDYNTRRGEGTVIIHGNDDDTHFSDILRAGYMHAAWSD